MIMQSDQTPEEIMKTYNSYSKDYHNIIRMKVHKGMYVLQESEALSNEQLSQHICTYSCRPTKHTPGLWKYEYDKIIYTLLVDNFRVKYLTK